MKEDGTLLVYAVDGRQSGYSSGLSQKDLAEEMIRRGCVWAVNLDGGGSTEMCIRDRIRVCRRMARQSFAFPSTPISSRGVQGASST